MGDREFRPGGVVMATTQETHATQTIFTVDIFKASRMNWIALAGWPAGSSSRRRVPELHDIALISPHP